jgi:hypothetical protein
MNNDYKINAFELQKKQYNKELSRIKIYEKILEKCYYKIKSSSNNENTYCFYVIPEYILGVPIFNLTNCVIYLIKKLRENGFICKYCHPLNLYISWYSDESYPLLTNDSNLVDNKINEKKIYKKPKKSYKNINDYKPEGFFLYKDLINNK